MFVNHILWGYFNWHICNCMFALVSSSHWLAHETAHVKPLFCQTLALHGLHIAGPWNCPCITTVLPHIHYMGLTLVASWNCHVKPLPFSHPLVLRGARIGWPMKLPIENHCFTTRWKSRIFHREITPTAISGPRFHAPLHISPPLPGPAGGPSRTWRRGSARWRHLM